MSGASGILETAKGIPGKIMGQGQGQSQTTTPSHPAYGANTPRPTANRYVSSYPEYTQPAPQQTIQSMGLEALYQGMLQNFIPTFNGASTQQQGMSPYQNLALNYKPSMTNLQQPQLETERIQKEQQKTYGI